MQSTTRVLRHDAVILAGGRATRLGGAVKPLVEVGGRSLLQSALDAAAGAQRVVVVGDVPVPEGVLRTVEDPPHSGPAAGLAAGLAALSARASAEVARVPGRTTAPWTLVLAADLPDAVRAVPALLAAAGEDPPVDGVCFHDETSHPQWMLAVYRSHRLRTAVAAVSTTDLSLRRLLAPLTLTTIPGEATDIGDCDTWEEIEAARARERTRMGTDHLRADSISADGMRTDSMRTDSTRPDGMRIDSMTTDSMRTDSTGDE